MTRSLVLVVGLATGLLACREPIGSDHGAHRTQSAFVPARSEPSVILATCTHHWSNPVTGAWGNAARWSPPAVPGPNDVACIDVAGTYTVTVGGAMPWNVKELHIGDGTSNIRVLVDSAAAFFFDQLVNVATASTLVLRNCLAPLFSIAGTIEIHGTMRVHNACTTPTLILVGAIVNHGTLDLHTTASLAVSAGEAFRNTGDIVVDAPVAVSVGDNARVRMEGGTIAGLAQLTFFGGMNSADTARFAWSAGTIAAQSGNAGRSTVLLLGTNLRLNDATLVGFIETEGGSAGGDSFSVTGDVGTGVHVLARLRSSSPMLLNTSTGDAVHVDGVLELSRGTQPGAVTFIAPFGLINRQRLTSGGGPIAIQTDSLVNEGAMTLHDTLTVGAVGDLLRNRGAITVTGGRLKLVGTAFIADGTVVGSTYFFNSNITGTGSLGSATVLQSSIDPGVAGAPRFGSLTFDDLFLGPGSTIVMEVGGPSPSDYDQLTIYGNTTWNGTLQLQEIAPFLGGICGPLQAIFQYGPFATMTGQFATILGANLAPGRAWRLAPGNASDLLVGYDPRIPISVSSTSLSTGEGLMPATYLLCARSAPTAPVTVALATDLAQAFPQPSATSLSPTDWKTPRSIVVGAVNDVIVEPFQVDTIRHVVASSDPAYHNAAISAVAVDITDNDGNADLGLSIVVPPPPLTVGQTFSVTFRDTNAGPTLSTGATFFVPMPTGLRYVSASGATCTTNSAGLSCHVAGTPSAGTMDFVITATATLAGTHQVTMTLTGEQPDAVSANNTLVKNIVVQ